MSNEPLPLYAQLKEQIIAAIRNGEFQPGDQLPSQRNLIQKYNMSHMTVRRALDELKNEGIINAIPGKGFYVAEETHPAEIGSLMGFAVHVRSLGKTPRTELLDAKLIQAYSVIARNLNVPEGTEIVYLRRLRFIDEMPFSLTSSYLPHHLCMGILRFNFAQFSLFDTLRQRYRLELAGSTSLIEALLADEELAKLLKLELPKAILKKEQLTYLPTEQIIEFSRTYLRGDQYHFRIDEGTTTQSRFMFTEQGFTFDD